MKGDEIKMGWTRLDAIEWHSAEDVPVEEANRAKFLADMTNAGFSSTKTVTLMIVILCGGGQLVGRLYGRMGDESSFVGMLRASYNDKDFFEVKDVKEV